MSSLFQEYQFDIFLSYRQKDNRSDQWVTQFVSDLQDELDALFKKDISIYFDENPHHGLHDAHDVDLSLKEKIRCAVFLPILSPTYCDPQSFAWKQEFLPFLDFAREDTHGLDIRLENGNVIKRIIPVKIREIDQNDKNLFEDKIGGTLRPIEFIYSEAGVNRPLKKEDLKSDNLSGTEYHNQLNKLAITIKSVIEVMRKDVPDLKKTTSVPETRSSQTSNSLSRNQRKKKGSLFWLLAIIIVIAGSFGIYKFFFNTSTENEGPVSIAIVPFRSVSTGEAEYGVGLATEIRSRLSRTKHFDFISSISSTLKYKDGTTDPMVIGESLEVDYILSGFYQVADDRIKIDVELVDTATGRSVWDLSESRELNNIFDVQTAIANKVLSEFALKNEDNFQRPTENIKAYTYYLQALDIIENTSYWQINLEGLDLLDKAIEEDPEFIDPYTLKYRVLAYQIWNNDMNWVSNDSLLAITASIENLVMEKAGPGYNAETLQMIKAYCIERDYEKALNYISSILNGDPNNYFCLLTALSLHKRQYQPEKAVEYAKRILLLNPVAPNTWTELRIIFRSRGMYEYAARARIRAVELGEAQIPDSRTEEQAFEKWLKEDSPGSYLIYLEQKKRNFSRIDELLDSLTVQDTLEFHYQKLYTKYLLGSADSVKYYGQLVKKQLNDSTFDNYRIRLYVDSFMGVNSEKYLDEEDWHDIGDNLFAERELLQSNMLIAILRKDYPKVVELLKQMNSEYPEYGDYSFLNDIPFDKIKEEYPPFNEAVENLKLPQPLEVESLKNAML